LEGRETEKKLTDYFIDDKNDLSIGTLAGCDGICGHSGLEKSHGYDGRNEDED